MVDEKLIWNREADSLRTEIKRYEEIIYIYKEHLKLAESKVSGMSLV